MKIENKNLEVGQIVYICDFRYRDIHSKPIRHVKPTKVIVCSNCDLPDNKRVFYSETHFKPIKENGKILKKIIAPFDNTGYRNYTGVCVGIFDTLEECKDSYNQQCDDMLEVIRNEKDSIIGSLEAMENDIINKYQ